MISEIFFLFLIASQLGVLQFSSKDFLCGSEAYVLVTLKGFKQSLQTFVAWGFCFCSDGTDESHRNDF